MSKTIRKKLLFFFVFGLMCAGLELPLPRDLRAANNAVIVFSTVGTTNWIVPAGISSIQVLVVAGGGGGGGNGGGGGGAGGMIFNSSYAVTPGSSITVTVGGGGNGTINTAPSGGNGGNSVFGTITATGGGGGASRDSGGAASSGGSGGGGGGTNNASSGTAGSGTVGQGKNGGNGTASDLSCSAAGGGGGGSGSAGTVGASGVGGNGGAGSSNSITGSAVTYAGGGGGGLTCNANTRGSGGSGGGGSGGGSSIVAFVGIPNTGGGGGGGGPATAGAAGGSGVVILSYVAPTVRTIRLFGSVSGAVNTTFLTSGTSWTVPSNWNSNQNSIEVIGGGGGGGTTFGGGGGGGAYSKITNLALTAGNSITYRIGAGGAATANGGDTFFNRTAGSANTCADTVSVCAKGGLGTNTSTGAVGGAAASGVGSLKTSGGNGGNDGGGGANGGGGGAGGSNDNGTSGSGGKGGTGDGGLGGTGGTSNTAGNPGTEWDATHGSGGGGAGHSASNGGGFAGGNYGGGGGAGWGGASFPGGAGTQGIIVIQYSLPVRLVRLIGAKPLNTSRVMIAVNHNMVGSGGVTNFPVYVDLSTMPAQFWAAESGNNCGDIRMFAGDKTTELPREVVTCNTTSKTGEVWFKAPSLSDVSDSVFYLVFGSGTSDYAVSATFGARNVWTNGYAAVYHLKDGTTLSGLDSTSNANNGTISNATAVSGEIDGAGSFASASNASISVGTPASLNITSDFTISAWINPTSFGSNSRGRIFDKNAGGSTGYEFGMDDSNVNNGLILGVNTATTQNTDYINSAANSVTTGIWQYAVGTFTASTKAVNFYVNGIPKGSGTVNASPSSNSSVTATIGRRSSATDRNFDGIIDELEVSTTPRSVAWIQTQYNNQSSPSSFYNAELEYAPLIKVYAQ